MTPARVAAILTLAGCALLSASAPALAAGPVACPAAFGSFSASNFPTACWRPYAPDSPFNRRLPAAPRPAADSAAILANLRANQVNFEGGKGRFALTSDAGRDGVYYARSSDPLVTIHCTFEWGPGTCTGTNHLNVDGVQIHVPTGAEPQPNGTDRHMTVVEQANELEFDFEHATWSADHRTLDVWSGAAIPAGPDLGTGLGGGGTAAGFSVLAGLITAPELSAGAIHHALVINVPCTRGAVYPAPQANGLPCSQLRHQKQIGTPAPLGALFQLHMSDAQIAATRAPAWERTIMTAMAHYGMYVNDTDGINDIELEAESDISYTSLGGKALLRNFIAARHGSYYAPLKRWILLGRAIPLRRLRVISPCFAQRTCPAGRMR
jgi:hypothetical protein